LRPERHVAISIATSDVASPTPWRRRCHDVRAAPKQSRTRFSSTRTCDAVRLVLQRAHSGCARRPAESRAGRRQAPARATAVVNATVTHSQRLQRRRRGRTAPSQSWVRPKTPFTAPSALKARPASKGGEISGCAQRLNGCKRGSLAETAPASGDWSL
jgi:hypothetical protein